MPNTPIADQISFFRSQINARRFNDETLRILESVLVSKDVKSLIEVRSILKQFLRSESLSVINEIAQKTVEQKLSILEFFVHAFALIGDIESCLALRYEALFLRDLKSTTNHQWLQVSYIEWLNLAEQSLDNGFYAVAGKACDNALLCLQRNDTADPQADKCFENMQVSEKIKRLKDSAVTSASSRSVQAQATRYLKKKTIQKSKAHSSICKEIQCVASSMFRNGIKKRNVRKLHEHQACNRFPMDHTSIQL